MFSKIHFVVECGVPDKNQVKRFRIRISSEFRVLWHTYLKNISPPIDRKMRRNRWDGWKWRNQRNENKFFQGMNDILGKIKTNLSFCFTWKVFKFSHLNHSNNSHFNSLTHSQIIMMFQIVASLAAMLTASAFIGVQTPTRNSKTVVMMAEKSKSLPFLPQPPNIVGMAGDVGESCFLSTSAKIRITRLSPLMSSHSHCPNNN